MIKFEGTLKGRLFMLAFFRRFSKAKVLSIVAFSQKNIIFSEKIFLFGRGPNRVMETACFDANVQ